MYMKDKNVKLHGKWYCFLNSKPVETPNRCLCLLREKNVKGAFTVWLMEIEEADGEELGYFWSYEGADYDIIRRELIEDFLEHALDDF